MKSHFDLNQFLQDSRELSRGGKNLLTLSRISRQLFKRLSLCALPRLHRHFLYRRPWSRFHSSGEIRRRPFDEQFDGQEEIDNRVRATYRDLLTVSGARAWAGRRIRGWNFARRRWDRACGANGANCWKRSCRIRLPLLMDLLRGIPESSTLRIKTAIRENSTSRFTLIIEREREIHFHPRIPFLCPSNLIFP